ncbi:MAG: hypothetical protein KDC98_07095, partial [Planctomycetes bacterium]|nr:hypothetical protein [Planctomycetota bacterium]
MVPFDLTRACCLLLTVLGLAASTAAQCGHDWITGVGDGLPRDGEVFTSTLWDPDGPGPETPRVVVAGRMYTVGSVAAWDPATGDWSAFGSTTSPGISGTIRALLALPNGDLIAGGEFTFANGPNRVARWNGTGWQPLGLGITGITGSVRALAAMPNGDIVAAGFFQQSGAQNSLGNIARWDGTNWLPLGTGTDSVVLALEVMPNGDLIAGGNFTQAGGVATGGIARWNGTNWAPVGSAINHTVSDLAIMPNGDLVAATVGDVRRWNGSTWTTLGAFAGNCVDVTSAGELVAGGLVRSGTTVIGGQVAQWNGTTWTALGTGIDTGVESITTAPGGRVVAVGDTPNTLPHAARIQHWDGASWHELGTGLSADGSLSSRPYVWASTIMPNGDLVIGGAFHRLGGVVTNNIACFDG